jgi:hypothetical protein
MPLPSGFLLQKPGFFRPLSPFPGENPHRSYYTLRSTAIMTLPSSESQQVQEACHRKFRVPHLCKDEVQRGRFSAPCRGAGQWVCQEFCWASPAIIGMIQFV